MDVKELIARLFEETNYEGEAVLIIAYGSRATEISKKNSDLDLLIITALPGSYRRALMIDGIPIDITIMSIEEAEENIIYSKKTGSAYFDGVLKNGIVVLDKIGVYDQLTELLSHKINEPRTVDGALLNRAEYHIYEFLNNPQNNNINYFSALELIRRIYHAKHNLPNIQSTKVFDLYSNRAKAKSYGIKLPDNDFMDEYISALRSEGYPIQKIWLEIFWGKINNLSTTAPRYLFLDSNSQKLELINLNNAIWRCEDMIFQHHPGAPALYYALIGEIGHLYELLFGKKLETDISLDTRDPNQMFQNLEYLFSLVDVNHDIDYNDYKIRVR